MSMNWTQYLLSKLAEEAVEVAKEALKCQQHGVASQYKGRNAVFELRNELIEVLAVAQMVGDEEDARTALGGYRLAMMPTENEDDDFYEIKHAKVERLCYYAMFDRASGMLELTKPQFDQVLTYAKEHAAKHNLTEKLFDVI